MKQNMGADWNHIKRSPTIQHISNSSCDMDSEICSNAEFPVYTVQIPPTPDNQMFCDVPGCVSNDVHVTVFSPCECGFKICRECYSDVLFSGDALCPRCKRLYRRQEELNRSLSVVKERKTMVKSKVNEFNHDGKLLFDDGRSTDRDTVGVGDSPFKQWKPLTRRIKISAAVIAPYRLLIVVKMVVLALFIYWRLTNPNEDAIWLWGMSVVCEIWFSFSWLLDQLPKLCPINRAANLDVLKQKFESSPTGKSDLPGIDVFVSSADPEKEPPLITANTILSILAADYPVEKLSCYVSDDGGALLTFEAMAEAASFANVWVPFCRKHEIEPRNPESYFSLKRDPYKNKVRSDFVSDRRRVKREYDEFKVRINGLSESIRRCSDAYNTQDELKAMKRRKEARDDEVIEEIKVRKATWMGNGTHWPGAWMVPAPEHTRADHASILQIMLQPASDEPQKCKVGEGNSIDLSEVDIRLPMLVYVSREKRPGYDCNKKAGAMNALVRASAVMSNGAFILNLDCDQYIYNSQALREGMCYMMDQDGESICYVQFPQKFEGIDPSDRYANQNNVFFDVNMRALDGIQGPVYVGTGCLFRRVVLYGIDPPLHKEQNACYDSRSRKAATIFNSTSKRSHEMEESDSEEMNTSFIPKTFGNSDTFLECIAKALFESLPLADRSSVKIGRAAGALITPRNPLSPSVLDEALNVISCWYEDKTEWGQRVGWIYGSVTEDIVTGYRMHERGWRSVYCVTKRDAFRGTAPINLTNRLHQVLSWATGSVEIFFSRNNAILAGPKLKLLQRIAYINVSVYPFTSIFLIVYCFLPALSLFTNQFIVQSLSINFLAYLLIMTLTLCALAILEIKWSGITLEEWWQNEQFWLIGGTSAHLIAVIQGLLKAIAGIEISFTLTSKSSTNDSDDEFADLHVFKWTSLMIPPCVIIMLNLIGITIAVSRNIYSNSPQWSKFIGGTFFSFCVLAHLYPFAKGLIGRKGKTPTVVFVWSGLISICISLLWVAIIPPSGNNRIGGWFQFL